MVLQAYGAAMPPVAKAAPQASRLGTFKAMGVAALSLMALALLVTSFTSSSMQPETVLIEEDLRQHLMSQDSRYSTEMKADDSIFETEGHSNTHSLSAWTGPNSQAFDTLKSISSKPVDEAENSIRDTLRHDHDGESKHSWFGKWGDAENYFRKSDSQRSANKWVAQLNKLKEAQAARRKREDQEYFSGVEKAFGKKAGLAMMEAFDGAKSKKSDSFLAKVKLDDKKLLARKEALEHNKKLPASKQNKIAENIHKAVAKAEKSAHAKKAKEVAAKKVAEAKEAKHPAKEAEKHTEAKKASEKSGVKEALEVAKKMAAHKSPVAKPAVKVEKKAAKTHTDLHHLGVVADGIKIKQLVHEFHHAHGAKKKALKARVMQLQQQIVNDFKKVTEFGQRAQTAFARAEAKEKSKKAHKHHSDSDSDSDDQDEDQDQDDY